MTATLASLHAPSSPRSQRRQRVADRLRAEGPLAAEVFRVAWPAMTHMALVTLMFLVGRAMVARHSSTALASLQISGTLVWATYATCTAFSAGTLAAVARSVGEGDRLAAARAARASVAFAALVGLAVFIPVRVANGALLKALFPAAEPAVLADAGAYLHIVLPVLPLAFVEAIAAAALQGAGDTRTPLLVAIAGNVVNVVVSATFIFGLGGAPALGVRGAAMGHAATMAIEGACLVAILFSRRSPLPLRAVGPRVFGGLGRVLSVSAPTFLEKLCYQGGYLVFVGMIGLLGSSAMGANQVMVSVEAICFLSADGLGVAAGAIVAQKLGAGRAADAGRAAMIGAAMAIALLSAFGILFAAAPELLMRAFTPDPGVVDVGARALRITALAQPFMAFATVVAMSLRGAGDTRSVLGVTFVCSLVVRLAVTYVVAIHWGYGLVGVWIGSTADWVCRSVLLALAFLGGRWRHLRV